MQIPRSIRCLQFGLEITTAAIYLVASLPPWRLIYATVRPVRRRRHNN